MQDLLFQWGPVLILALLFVIVVRKDPRRFGLGVLLVVIVWSAAVNLTVNLTSLVIPDADTAAWVVSIAALVMLLASVFVVGALGAFLIVNTFTMWRKEGLGLAPQVSGMLGAGMLLYVVVGLMTVFFEIISLVPPLLFIGLPAVYLGFLFVSFLVYSLLYNWATRRFGRPVDAVIVLGSGLGDGERVTPLLAGRLEQGRAVFERSRAAGRDPVLVVSGGKGDDEQLAEAEAMGAWLVERGFDRDKLLLEKQSRDTEENLAFSTAFLRGRGDVVVATSDYHAFRSAIVMRKEGIPGYTVGCRTARYYWPSATVREFAAILLEHSRANLLILTLLWLPALIYLVYLVTMAVRGL